MPKFQPNQDVYVPATLLPDGEREIFAMVRRRVNSVTHRSIYVDLPGGATSRAIGSSMAHAQLGFAIISIGDFQTELGLIAPLSKSVLQFSRLLLPDDHLIHVNLRSLEELAEWWSRYHAAYTHVILIGHGCDTSLEFGVNGPCTPADIGKAMSPAGAKKKMFVSLCCETGKAPFAAEFSKLPFCGAFVAPEHSIHGAVGSQFLQTFLSLHLLQGKFTKVAFNNANALMPGNDSFAIWRSGAQVP